MANGTIPLTSFTGGEWSPRLHGRVDVAKYNTSCEVLENMIVFPHGGATRRPGLEFIEDAKTDNVRLIPFEYNREQAYVLEFGEYYIRFYRDAAQVAPGGVPLEIASPFKASELADLSICQSNDVLFIAHKDTCPQRLERIGEDQFTISDIPFVNTAAPAGSSKKVPLDWIETRVVNGQTIYIYDWPTTVTLFQSRLVFGGNLKKPQTVWMSKAFNLYDFTRGENANDSKAWNLSSTRNNSIQWLEPVKKLMIGTTGGEFSLSLPDNSVSVQVDKESEFGSKTGLKQLVGNGVIYASRDGRKLREMTYSYEADGFVSPELSLFSEHLTRAGIKEFDFAQNPDGILWTVLNNGEFCGFTYLKSQEVQAWHRHSTQGQVKSVCCIEGSDHSEVWFAVYRNGKTRIERMAKAYEGDTPNSVDCAYLDSYLTYEGSPVQTISGLDHLEGMKVSILGDGLHFSERTVVDGSITLEKAVSKAVIGLKYKWRMIPLRLEGASPAGFSQGKRKRLESLIIRFERSAGLSHKIKEGSLETELPTRKFGDSIDKEIELFTGDKFVKLHNTWDRNGQFELFGDSPFPMTIIMIAAKVVVNE